MEALTGLYQHQTAEIAGKSGKMAIEVHDPLLIFLVQKSLALSKADTELYKTWIKTRLTAFDDKALIHSDAWSDSNIAFLASQAVTEPNWLEVYAEAASLDEIFDALRDSPGPFSG